MAESSESKDFSVDNPELISSRQRRLWTLFQQTATSLTHIYKCKSSSKCQISTSEDQEAWLAFQSAASALTSLYRESADILSSLEKNNANATNSVAKEDSNVANNESYVTMTTSAMSLQLQRLPPSIMNPPIFSHQFVSNKLLLFRHKK